MTKKGLTGYFADCDLVADEMRASYYALFLKHWVQDTVADYLEFDKVIFWFSVEDEYELRKVVFVKNKEIYETYLREAWLDTNTEGNVEFTENEAKVVGVLSRSALAIPIDEFTFILTVYIKPNQGAA